MGISKSTDGDIKDYVLGKISNDDLKIYDELFNTLNVVIDDYFTMNFSDLMSKHNKKNR